MSIRSFTMHPSASLAPRLWRPLHNASAVKASVTVHLIEVSVHRAINPPKQALGVWGLPCAKCLLECPHGTICKSFFVQVMSFSNRYCQSE
eukprot:3671508-Amphidinium_carterae.1